MLKQEDGLVRIVDGSRVTFGTKITDRIWKDSNGQLICRDCPIARTGSYDYLESEIKKDGDPNKIVKVYRTEDEVFNPVSMASFEDKPFVDDHPEEDVTLDNYKELSKGFMHNIRRGEGEYNDCLMCDIVVTDKDLIDTILNKRKRELSLGYDTSIVERDGKYYMTNIRGNHLALVDDGRAGCATIRDSASGIIKGGSKMSKKNRMKLFDEDVFEIEEIKNEDEGVEETQEEISTVEETPAAEPTIGELMAEVRATKDLLTQVLDILKQPKADCGTVDGDKTEEVIEEGVIGDEDPVEGEPVSTEEKIVENTETEEAVEDCGGEMLDADKIPEEGKVEARDSKKTYAKFASVKDSASTGVSSEAIRKSWQERYNRAANK